MLTISTYLRLMRLHQPVGIWLLLWPCWWVLALASHGLPPLRMLALFALGAVLMRSAGCIVNDLADRTFDAQVERTRNRPLASGEIGVKQAFLLLALLLGASFVVAVLLGKAVVLWAVLSLLPVAIYPFMKRISWWPQLYLGFTFNWGALMGWAAVRGNMELPAILLFAGCLFWTLGYDTIYAHQDKVDDVRIGVRSTALRLGNDTKKYVGVFYLLALLLWTLADISAGGSIWFFPLALVAQIQLGWQICTVEIDNSASCERVFKSNAWLGIVVFCAFLAGSFN